MTHQSKLFATLLAVALTAAFSFSDNASAATKKKLTYEEAYTKCKAIMDKERTPGTTTQSNDRYTRGAACMKHYGYTL